MNQTQRVAVRRTFRAALICFLWTIAIWLILYARAVSARHGIGSGAATAILFFGLPVLAGTLAYQFVLVPWMTDEGVSPRARFFWTILVPCALAAGVLLIAR
jgi:hypothetical protein